MIRICTNYDSDSRAMDLDKLYNSDEDEFGFRHNISYKFRQTMIRIQMNYDPDSNEL